MAQYQRRDPLLAYNFQVSLLDSKDSDGVGLTTIALSTAGLRTMAAFSEVSGLEMTMDVEERAVGGLNHAMLKFPGRVKWNNLVMKRGVVAKRDPLDTSDLWTWYESYLNGVGTRKDGIIVLLNEERKPQLTWSFKRGLPLKWTGPSLHASQNQVAIESIEIAHEGLRLVRSGGALGEALGAAVGAVASLF
ncbi:MAG TPA: phage tail protein [Sphingomicrobium sp.]|nr:phage tail protein [Sphingomicrobium sp.]